MFSNKAMYRWIIVVITFAAMSLGVWTVTAQDPTTPDAPSRMGNGMMGWGRPFGGSTTFDAVATALDLEPVALAEALQSGQTLGEVADAQGVEIQVVVDAIIVVRQEHLNAMVEQGMITEAQAAQRLEYMNTLFPEHLDWIFSTHYSRGQSHGHFENCPFFEALSQEE